MIPARAPVQRPRDARLLVVSAGGRMSHAPRSRLVEFLRRGDVVVANDAATFPASLHGVHERTGSAIEARLAGRSSLRSDDVRRFIAVVFGEGDFRMRTEDRPSPPPLGRGDRLRFGPLNAVVEATLDHPRLIAMRVEGSIEAIWEGIARHGRPIQYAHVDTPLNLWDVWTPIAAVAAAFEPPSAGFVLDWTTVQAMGERGVGLASITLAAGISSTGDPDLDRRLPLNEPYRITRAAASAISRAKRERRRIVAIGTTVVRALEHAATRDGVVRAGDGVADQRVGPDTRLRIVDAIVSGTHEPDSSHYQLLRAFVDDETLAEASAALEARGYRTHEFGDSVLVEKSDARNAETAGTAGNASNRLVSATDELPELSLVQQGDAVTLLAQPFDLHQLASTVAACRL